MTWARRGSAQLTSILLGLMVCVVTLVCGFVAMRFLLLLTGSLREPGGFADFVVTRSEAFVAPFLYLTGAGSPRPGGGFEAASVLAILAYALAGLVVYALVTKYIQPPKTVGYRYNVGREPRPRSRS